MFNVIKKGVTYFKVAKAMMELDALLLLFKRIDPNFKDKSLKEYRDFMIALFRDDEKFEMYKKYLLRCYASNHV